MFYGYHKALCLQRLKGDVFMDFCFLLHYLQRSKINPLFFFFFFSKCSPIAPLIKDVTQRFSLIKKETVKQSVQGTYFKHRRVLQWIIIQLISEINNNNCLSLLIRLWKENGAPKQSSSFWFEQLDLVNFIITLPKSQWQSGKNDSQTDCYARCPIFSLRTVLR